MFVEVKGFEEYFLVNEEGDVYSLRTNKLLRQHTTKKGYKTISTKIKGKSFCLKVHRLVAMSFLPNPDNKRTVNHRDGNKSNNSLSNLEWATHSENTTHAYESGLMTSYKGEDHIASILTEEQVRKILELYVPGKKGGFGKHKIAKALGLPVSIVDGVVRKRAWKHLEV